MATPFNLMRLMVSCMLATTMLAACGGSQMSGSSLGTTQAAGAPNSHSTLLPTDGGGDCGGDAHGGFGPNDGGGCCGGGDGGSFVRGTGFHNNDGGGHCKNITVTPHVIYFTVSNPGPVTVTVKTRTQGVVSEVDTCGGASGVATVTQISTSDEWSVAAGAQQGSCKALFILNNTTGQKIGQAVLHITNFL
jgi:hypothetical protein